MEYQKELMTEYIKVNIPKDEAAYRHGNGEGVWVLVDEKTKAAHDQDETGVGYIGILDNYSIYYPKLVPGTVIEFEMRGANRPVASIHFLKQ